jgi:two-component system OmpR family response regulator
MERDDSRTVFEPSRLPLSKLSAFAQATLIATGDPGLQMHEIADRRSTVTDEPQASSAETTNSRVLVVDDEPNLVEVVAMALRFQGFEVETATSGHEAILAVERFKPHLMVLDVMLPDIEGFEVANRLGAQRAGVPIIFLTARDSTEDKVRGLSGGGDDYMTKPFSLEELVARIRTILRRTGQAAAESGRLVFADLELDEESHQVNRAGEMIELTATEFRLLRYLMLNPRRVLTRAQLLDHVWDYDFGGDGRVLETYVSYLRKKLDAHGPPLIRTVRGVGYGLQAPRS